MFRGHDRRCPCVACCMAFAQLWRRSICRFDLTSCPRSCKEFDPSNTHTHTYTRKNKPHTPTHTHHTPTYTCTHRHTPTHTHTHTHTHTYTHTHKVHTYLDTEFVKSAASRHPNGCDRSVEMLFVITSTRDHAAAAAAAFNRNKHRRAGGRL